MSKLATLLGRAESEVKQLVDGLEAKTGFNSLDVSFLAAHHQEVRQALTSIGLDPDDTTGPELYHALQAKFVKDSQVLDKSLGITQSLSDEQKMNRAQKLINLAVGKPDAWVLKLSAVKSLLRKLPPSKTTKRLGYRSLESMLKHEELGIICHTTRQLESATWKSKFDKVLHKSGHGSYEMRPVKFLLNENLQGIKAEPISATILLGSAEISKHSVLSLSLLVYEELEKISRVNHQGLAKAVPSLAWWRRVEHLAAIKEDRAISLNLHDVAANWVNSLSHTEQVATHAAELIMHKLVSAYSQKPAWAMQETSEPEVQPVPEAHDLAREMAEV